MKEQIRSNLSIQQFNNVESLTTRPFRSTLGVEGDIFMPEPGQGEVPKRTVSKPPRVPRPERGKPLTPEQEAIVKGRWERDYHQGRDLSSLPFDEQQTVRTAIKAGVVPIAGGVGQPPEEGRRMTEDISQAEAAGRLEEAARRGQEVQQQAGAAGGAGDGGDGEPPRTAEGGDQQERRDPREVLLNDSLALVRIIRSGTPDTYNQTFAQIEDILNPQNSNDRNYGQLIANTMENLKSDREHIREIDYFLEYAMERILSRADVSPKSEYPRFSLEEDLNLGDILAYARIYDHSIGRPEGTQGTIFKYLDDLRGRRHIMHELFRNMKERRAYVSYITQNLRKEGLAFVEKQVAGVADSQIIYEKFLGSALSQKRGWLTSDDIEAVDIDVENFMTSYAAQFSKEIKDEDGNVIDSRPLRPWELRRAAIVGKSLNAAMQRRLVYTVMGDVPIHDITTLLDSVDSEELARILAPIKLIAERFLGIDTNTRKIFIEEVLRMTKELGDANDQQYGYGPRDEAGSRKGLYGKREDSWAILDTGITDPKSNSWRGTKMFLMQKDYQTEAFEGQNMSIGDYLDRIKWEERTVIERRLRSRHPKKSEREINRIIDSPEYRDQVEKKFNNRVKEVIEKQRLFLGPLLQMGGLIWENKQIIWEKVAELLPSRIAAFFPEETLEIIRTTYNRPEGTSRDELLEIWNGRPEQNGQPRQIGLKEKLFLAESKRVADDAENIKGKTWGAVGQGVLKNLSDYYQNFGIGQSPIGLAEQDPEIRVIEELARFGKEKAPELAKIKFPYTPFLDDVPKTDWENIEDFSYDRILVYDHSDFQAGYNEILGLMGKPITQPQQVIEAFVKASAKIQGPLGLKYPGGAQGVLEKYISAYLSMAQEFELAKYFGPIMKLRRIPRSKMEVGNLQANIAINEAFTAQVLDGLAQHDVISDDPVEVDKNGLTQVRRMKKENKADMKRRIIYWVRLIAYLLGPILATEIARTLLPREAAEQVIAGF